MEEMLYVLRLTFFSPPLIFTLVAASINFSFSHRRYKIFMFFFQRNWSSLLFLLFFIIIIIGLFLASSFSVFHVNANINI